MAIGTLFALILCFVVGFMLGIMYVLLMEKLSTKPNKVEPQPGNFMDSYWVRITEGLILQLPKNHDGRNTWLINHGLSGEAAMLRYDRSKKNGAK